ncbi:DUF2953 domain-containing protein [Clostridium sp.]|uniref:DUF2953 domain-containing protein n=1 Tax=Clostridium sp. TaxID=1506 RepID=UPI001DB0719B|nr:DUF2953 domain-containing protein [Clostridium sp.]MBS5938996.1 DUF2953 domain-containing protein [Clostridium sp.]
MIFLFILSLIILLIIFPIPIKIEVKFIDNIFFFKFFNKLIYTSKDGIQIKFLKKIIENKSNRKDKKYSYKEEHPPKKKKVNLKKKKRKIAIIRLYTYLRNNKFKPLIKVKGYLDYGIEDAALCALIYGILNIVPGFIYYILSIVFEVNSLRLNINPEFNKKLLSFGITGIFYFNIANIIYILFLFYKSLEYKEVTP